MAEGVRILNVNDDPATRYFVRRVLERAGYEVLDASTGAEALALARQKPDVAVLDVKLPDLNGHEVCARLKSDPETAGIAVMQTSATLITPENRVQGLDSGADAYLVQPFEASELLATVRALARMRAAEHEARKKAELLAEADHRKDEFLAMLAHELRNPLAAISTAVGILERGANPLSGGKDGRMRAIIQRQTHHLARLVDDLLDVSRITRGKIELRLTQLDLTAVLQQAVQLARPKAESRGLSLSASLPDRPLWVEGDPTRLEQVFTNLLDNATKYTDSGGEIFLSVEPLAGRAEVRIRDTGIGIPPESLGRIFDLFSQVDGLSERARGGLGIGLTVVQRLVQMHGGDIQVFSEGKSRGSEFRVTLPVLKEQAAPAEAGTSEEEPGPSPKRRVLLVEDNADARQSLRTLLEMWGHQVHVARDGMQGLKIAASFQPEVALVDLGLPGMDGFEVASRLRHSAGAGLTLVAISGFGGAIPREKAERAGFNQHLLKPVDPVQLERLLRLR